MEGSHRPAFAAALAAFLASGVLAGAETLDPDPPVQAIVAASDPAALLADVDRLVAFGTRRWDQPGGKAAEEWLRAQLEALPLDRVVLQDFDSGADNVIGVLRGSRRPERLHVIGAHYDSLVSSGATDPAPGADDNASDTAAVLETARAIAASGRRPAETILFIFFAEEEPGLVGSGAFVASLASWGAVADMLCLDVIGYLAPGKTAASSITSSKLLPSVSELIDRVSAIAGTYLPDQPLIAGLDCG